MCIRDRGPPMWPWRCGLMARPVSGVEWSGVHAPNFTLVWNPRISLGKTISHWLQLCRATDHKILMWSLPKWLNLILYPSKHGIDIRIILIHTMHIYWDIDENKILSNGGLNLNIVWIAKGWQSGIIQILKEHIISDVWRVLQGSPKIWGLYFHHGLWHHKTAYRVPTTLACGIYFAVMLLSVST